MWVLKSKTKESYRIVDPIFKCVMQGGNNIQPIIYNNILSAWWNAWVWGLLPVKVNLVDNPMNTHYKHWIYDDYHWVVVDGIFTNINGFRESL